MNRSGWLQRARERFPFALFASSPPSVIYPRSSPATHATPMRSWNLARTGSRVSGTSKGMRPKRQRPAQRPGRMPPESLALPPDCQQNVNSTRVAFGATWLLIPRRVWSASSSGYRHVGMAAREMVRQHNPRIVRRADDHWEVQCLDCYWAQKALIPLGIGIPIADPDEAEWIVRNHKASRWP
jgi:hypothetical protein